MAKPTTMERIRASLDSIDAGTDGMTIAERVEWTCQEVKRLERDLDRREGVLVTAAEPHSGEIV